MRRHFVQPLLLFTLLFATAAASAKNAMPAMRDLRIETDAQGLFKVEGTVDNPDGLNLEAEITVYQQDGFPRFRVTTPATNGISTQTRLQDMHAWSPEDPFTYTLQIKLLTRPEREVFQEFESELAFRAPQEPAESCDEKLTGND